MTTNDASETFQLGVYRHYKGHLYRALLLAKLEQDGEAGPLHVVYVALYDDGHSWIRPLSEFTSTVTTEGKPQPRFQFLHP